jgi:hypothetical protein
VTGIGEGESPSPLCVGSMVDTPCMKARRESSVFFLWLPPSAAIAFLVLGVRPAVDVCGVLSGVTAFFL